jgi:16S rRNA (cytosine967-C5)-methyltransferase
VRLNSSAVPEIPGFEAGGWWVQDLAASIPARLIPADAKDVLDLCAAPGGKTMQLAAAGHSVTSLDNSESRLARLRENLERTRLTAELIVADALNWTPKRLYDAILLDAPCSATGTFRRHPEVLYRARPAIIRDNADLQARLIRRAADQVRPGGTLIYSVCSLEPQEGERIVSAFLGEHSGFELRPASDPPRGISPAPEGWVRIVPGMLESAGGLDGFFVARLVRRGE